MSSMFFVDAAFYKFKDPSYGSYCTSLAELFIFLSKLHSDDPKWKTIKPQPGIVGVTDDVLTIYSGNIQFFFDASKYYSYDYDGHNIENLEDLIFEVCLDVEGAIDHNPEGFFVNHLHIEASGLVYLLMLLFMGKSRSLSIFKETVDEFSMGFYKYEKDEESDTYSFCFFDKEDNVWQKCSMYDFVHSMYNSNLSSYDHILDASLISKNLSRLGYDAVRYAIKKVEKDLEIKKNLLGMN